MGRIIETTDKSGRLGSAARGAKSYYDRSIVALNRVLEIADTPAKRDAIKHDLAELRRTWKNSRMRAVIEERGLDPDKVEGVEQRHEPEQRLLAEPVADRVTKPQIQVKESGRRAFIQGIATPFEKWSHDLGGFKEMFARGAFKKVLPTCDCRALVNHDSNIILGRNVSGSLLLRETDAGLWFRCSLLKNDGPSSTWMKRILRGDVTGCSISFWVRRDKWVFPSEPGGLDQRIVTEVGDLFDICPVVYPAYPDTVCSIVYEGRDADAGPRIAPEDIEAHNARRMRLMEAQVRLGQEPCQPDCQTFSRDDLDIALDLHNQYYDERPISAERQRDIARGYRRAGRVINRLQAVKN